MGPGPTEIPLNFENDLAHHLDTQKNNNPDFFPITFRVILFKLEPEASEPCLTYRWLFAEEMLGPLMPRSHRHTGEGITVTLAKKTRIINCSQWTPKSCYRFPLGSNVFSIHDNLHLQRHLWCVCCHWYKDRDLWIKVASKWFGIYSQAVASVWVQLLTSGKCWGPVPVWHCLLNET